MQSLNGCLHILLAGRGLLKPKDIEGVEFCFFLTKKLPATKKAAEDWNQAFGETKKLIIS